MSWNGKVCHYYSQFCPACSLVIKNHEYDVYKFRKRQATCLHQHSSNFCYKLYIRFIKMICHVCDNLQIWLIYLISFCNKDYLCHFPFNPYMGKLKNIHLCKCVLIIQSNTTMYCASDCPVLYLYFSLISYSNMILKLSKVFLVQSFHLPPLISFTMNCQKKGVYCKIAVLSSSLQSSSLCGHNWVGCYLLSVFLLVPISKPAINPLEWLAL